MATTTNYGWTTPDDTALVKNGASAIRTLGTAIDTTTFNNASAAIAKTIVDAKGDLIAATAADTVARLAVGTNGQVLTADSTAATGLAYTTISSGGMTLLSTTTLTGASVTVSSISGAYNNLLVLIFDLILSANGVAVLLRANGITTSDYGGSAAATSGTSTPTLIQAADSASSFTIGKAGAATSGRRTMRGEYSIPLYSSTVYKKSINGLFFGTDDNGIPYGGYAVGSLNEAAAITSLTFLPASGTFTSGTALIYGVK